MDPILIAVIAVLCQYPLAVFTLVSLFRSNEPKNTMIIWDVFIVAVPFIGVISYWIYYAIKGRKLPKREIAANPNGDEKPENELPDIGIEEPEIGNSDEIE